MPEKTKNRFWDTVSIHDWKKLQFPWRPTKKELNFYKKQLKKIQGKKKKILILGSTPELRQIASDLKIKTDIVDFSSKMYLEMSKIPKISTLNENFYNNEWLKFTSKKSNQYDIILGDLIERLLPEKKLKKMAAQLSRNLKKNGKLILRVHLSEKEEKEVNFNKIIKPYGFLININKDSDYLFFLLTPYFLKRDHSINIKKMIASTKNEIDNYTNKKQLLLKEFLRKCETYKLKFYAYSNKKINDIFSSYFLLKKCENCTITNDKTSINYTSLKIYEKLP